MGSVPKAYFKLMIEGIKKTKGVTYIGAELRGLTFDVITTGGSIDFIYKNIKSIVD